MKRREPDGHGGVTSDRSTPPPIAVTIKWEIDGTEKLETIASGPCQEKLLTQILAFVSEFLEIPDPGIARVWERFTDGGNAFLLFHHRVGERPKQVAALLNPASPQDLAAWAAEDLEPLR